MKSLKLACMMRVKNEADWLKESLTITSQFADYITVLDDGSTDGTADICKSFPKVRYYYQQKELDEARDKNQLLKWTLEGEPDWILCLDGDEVLEITAGERIFRELVKIDRDHPKFTHFQMQILYFWNDKTKYRVENGIYSHFWISRLFTTWGQNLHELAYFPTNHGGNFHCGSIPGNLKGRGKPIDVKIKHFGYLTSEIRNRKFKFYTKMDFDHAKNGYYDHLTDEKGMILSPWVERKAEQYSAFFKDSHYFNHQRTEIIEKIPGNSRHILDVGCANGLLGKLLKEKVPDCKVYGIELDPLAAGQASLYLDSVINENVEQLTDLPFGIERFDTIICADLLEHLQDPNNTLQFLARYLKEEGTMVTSIPNVRHFSVIQSLMNGSWTYENAGIMDETHLRFFTLKEMKKMLLDNGLEPKEIAYTSDKNYLFKTPENQQTFTVETPQFILKNLSKQDAEELQAVQYIIKSSKLRAKTAPDKLVSIIIVTLNQLELTDICLDSILKSTTENYQIVVVDNGSSDGTVEYLKNRPDVTLIENGENKGFASACNAGIAYAKGDYLVFLNNDTVVTNGWLSRLVWHAEKEIKIGLVGPMTNYAGSNQWIKDLVLDGPMEMNHYAQELMAVNWRKGFETDFLSGFCLLAKRAVIDEIGGFDEQFLIGNYEDDDYCLRAKLADYKLFAAQDVYVHHFGGSTFQGEKINHADSIKTNWHVFRKKWGLPEDLAPPKVTRYNYLKWVTTPVDKEELYIPPVEKKQEKLVTVLFFIGEGNQKRLNQSINSLIKQKYRNIEVIILDHKAVYNQSPVHTRVDWPYPTLYLQSSGKQCKSSALLNGLKLTSGEYIAYIQEGDILYPHHVEELVEKILNTEENVVYAEMYMPETHETKLPLASFIHSRECLKESLFNDEEMLSVPDETFYVPLLKFLSSNYEFAKLDNLTGEAG